VLFLELAMHLIFSMMVFLMVSLITKALKKSLVLELIEAKGWANTVLIFLFLTFGIWEVNRLSVHIGIYPSIQIICIEILPNIIAISWMWYLDVANQGNISKTSDTA
jgi:uncharacterized membrane protein